MRPDLATSGVLSREAPLRPCVASRRFVGWRLLEIQACWLRLTAVVPLTGGRRVNVGSADAVARPTLTRRDSGKNVIWCPIVGADTLASNRHVTI